MVIALKEVIDEGLLQRAIIMVIVAIFITLLVYGVVAVIVKMDDVGLSMVERGSGPSQRVGLMLVSGMPRLLTWLSIIGTAAMLWVGGHILLVGSDELGWHWPYDVVHDAEKSVHDVGSIGGVLEWLVNTGLSAVIGIAVGLVVVAIVARLPMGSKNEPAVTH